LRTNAEDAASAGAQLDSTFSLSSMASSTAWLDSHHETGESSGRRGRGLGKPTAQSVSPLSAASKGRARVQRLQTSSRSRADDEVQSPYRVGPSGLVVMIVPAQIKAACAKRGWSLAQLARRAGISYPTLKSSLAGKAVRPRTAWRLARALGEGSAMGDLDLLVTAR
jgi:hypothetical protein